MKEKIDLNARRRARRLAMQALYQWQMSELNIAEIEGQFIANNDLSTVDAPYFLALLHGVPKDKAEIDALISEFLDRDFAEINPLELAVLRLGTFELKHRPDVPYKVVINESVNLAKKFGAAEGHKFVNGILHHVAQKLQVDAKSKTK